MNPASPRDGCGFLINAEGQPAVAIPYVNADKPPNYNLREDLEKVEWVQFSKEMDISVFANMPEDEFTVAELQAEQQRAESGEAFIYRPKTNSPMSLPPSIIEMEERAKLAWRALRPAAKDHISEHLGKNYKKKWDDGRDLLDDVLSLGKMAWGEDGGKEEAVLTTVLKGMHDIDHAIRILKTQVQGGSPTQCLAVVRIMEMALYAYGLSSINPKHTYQQSDYLKWADDFLKIMKRVNRRVPGLLRRRAFDPNNGISPFQGLGKDFNGPRAARMASRLEPSSRLTKARDNGQCQITAETMLVTAAHILPHRVTNLGPSSVLFLLAISLMEPQEVSREIYKLCFGSRCCSPANMITIARELETKYMNNCFITIEAVA
ncbi:hypothetical protein AOQ84DRAFT_408847 [Glonium stellatum]|uniref:Uncharacterized protein n=1 Tax=Glonium stellatum TaxID=574774 RepID=A0A8E2EYY7_9PEZI|nr:hypothetical protein AOQ84DRAFT_408847 [Glonium stellatum]